MPYRVEHRPRKDGRDWAKINKRTGKIVSRHRSKAKAQASIRAYYATRNSLVVHSAHTHIRNTLRIDPTRTSLIRKAFIVEVNRRYGKLQKAVRNFIVELDALGLGDRKSFITMAQPREYEFRTDAGKVQAFNDWFDQQVKVDILAPSPGTPLDQPWSTKYVESAYRRGQLNAYLASKQAGLAEELGIGAQSQEQFLRSAFGQPETLSKVQLLGTRAFEGMKGLNATMKTELNRILAQGIADGRGPNDLAKEMTGRIGSLTRSRARTIARTEVIHAHAEGQLDAYEDLGVKELGVKAEWSTAGDDRVCSRCGANEGEVFDMEEARGMIPLHPNCRCSWIPHVPDELTKEDTSSEMTEAGLTEDVPRSPLPEQGIELKEWRAPDLSDYKDLNRDQIKRLGITPRITEDERKAIRKYGQGYHDWINKVRREGANPATFPDVVKDTPKVEKLINSALGKSSPLTEDIKVYRGIRLKELPDYKPGQVITDRGIISTNGTKSKAILDRFGADSKLLGKKGVQLEIYVPKGSQVTYVRDFVTYKSEDEILINSGQFRVISQEGSKVKLLYEGPVL